MQKRRLGRTGGLAGLGRLLEVDSYQTSIRKKGCVRAAPWQVMLSESPITTPFSAGAFGETAFDGHSQPNKIAHKSIGSTPRQTACLERDGEHATTKRPPEDARSKTRASNNGLWNAWLLPSLRSVCSVTAAFKDSVSPMTDPVAHGIYSVIACQVYTRLSPRNKSTAPL